MRHNRFRQGGLIQHIPHIDLYRTADLCNRNIICATLKWIYGTLADRVQYMKSPGHNGREENVEPYGVPFQHSTIAQFAILLQQAEGQQDDEYEQEIGRYRSKVAWVGKVLDTLGPALVIGKAHDAALQGRPFKIVQQALLP
ncbi:hypothetical protein D3C72_1956210 [compost metagenome]